MQEKVEFPTTAKELHQVQVTKDVASILEYVYQDRKAYYEVNAAIYSEYYDDETVMLRDLLFPESSPLYKTENFKKYKSPEGFFKKRFFEALAQGNYPVLKEAMALNKPIAGIKSSATNGVAKKLDAGAMLSASAPAPDDTALEIYSNSSGVSIYFPYSENFGTHFTSTYFDNINTDPRGRTATIVNADREANSAPGKEPYICGTRTDMKLCYTTVTVNDAYAEVNETHIVGGGADIMCHIPGTCEPAPPPTSPGFNRVFIGWIRMTGTQKDNLVSLSKANGGGSELAIGRGSGYLRFENEQVTNWDGDFLEPAKKFKRKDIKKGRWRKFYGVWDSDWKAGNTEQVLAVWEKDNRGEQTFTGSIVTAVRNATSGATA